VLLQIRAGAAAKPMHFCIVQLIFRHTRRYHCVCTPFSNQHYWGQQQCSK